MTRGGYITIILFLIGFMVYQNHWSSSLLDRYEKLYSSSYLSIQDSDSVDVQISDIKDSIKDVYSIIQSDKKDTTIIKNTYVKNICVIQDSSSHSDVKTKFLSFQNSD